MSILPNSFHLEGVATDLSALVCCTIYPCLLHLALDGKGRKVLCILERERAMLLACGEVGLSFGDVRCFDDSGGDTFGTSSCVQS